jgi:hypothetical protein
LEKNEKMIKIYVLDIPKYSFIILWHFLGLQRGITLSGNIFKISLETYSQILIFC